MKTYRWIMLMGLCALMVLGSTPGLAQQDTNAPETCPGFVTAAIENTQTACEGTNRNQTCYGNAPVQAQPKPSAENFSFQVVGDTVNVSDVQALRLSALNLSSEDWGIARMELQASLPSQQPENVTLLLFGDVELTDQGGPPIEGVEATANTNINVRLTPDTTIARIGTLDVGDTVVAELRLADNSWVRVRLPDGSPGWIFSDLLTFAGDLTALNVIVPGEATEPYFGPMQAFTLRSGADDSPCAEAPESGLMVQTPEGVGAVRFLVNEVAVNVGSTVYFQAVPGDRMTVQTYEGRAVFNDPLTGERQVVVAGTQANMQMDDDMQPMGMMGDVEPMPTDELYQSDMMFDMLPEDFETAEPLTQAELDLIQAYYADELDFSSLDDEDFALLYDYLVDDFGSGEDRLSEITLIDFDLLLDWLFDDEAADVDFDAFTRDELALFDFFLGDDSFDWTDADFAEGELDSYFDFLLDNYQGDFDPDTLSDDETNFLLVEVFGVDESRLDDFSDDNFDLIFQEELDEFNDIPDDFGDNGGFDDGRFDDDGFDNGGFDDGRFDDDDFDDGRFDDDDFDDDGFDDDDFDDDGFDDRGEFEED